MITLENSHLVDPTTRTYPSTMYESMDSKTIRAWSLEDKIFT